MEDDAKKRKKQVEILKKMMYNKYVKLCVWINYAQKGGIQAHYLTDF